MKLLMLGSGSYKSSLSFRIVALGTQLTRRGWQVSLMVPAADKYNNFTPDPQASLEPVRLIQPWQLKTKSASLNLLPYLLSSLIKLLRTPADAIYLYKPTPITVLGLLPRLLVRTPVILDLDDLGSEVMAAQGQSSLQVRLVAVCEHLAMRYASAVVVASTFLESIVRERYPRKTVLVLSNGVDPDDYPLATEITPRPAIYYFGALNRLSLIEDFLYSLPQVIAEMPKTHATIVGGGSALDQAKKLAESLGLGKHITFTGWVDMFDIQKYAHFGDIAICYQPDSRTVRAASNMKVFQYMALASVPVVGDVGELGSYVGHGQAGAIVPSAAPERLAATLIDLLKQPAKRMQLARAARRRAEQIYSWQVLSEELAAFIEAQTVRRRQTAATVEAES